MKGFTLFELMAVIVMGFIMLVFGTPIYSGYVERAHVAHAVGDIGEIHLRVSMFDLIHSRYPTSLNEIDLPNEVDPWGNPYVFLSFDGMSGNGPKRKNRNMVPVNTGYDVYSMGPDGKTATPFTSASGGDDVVMAGDGTYFGRADNYEASL